MATHGLANLSLSDQTRPYAAPRRWAVVIFVRSSQTAHQMHLSPVICGSQPLDRSILWWYTISVGVTFASDLRFPSRAIDTGDAHARYAMMTVIEEWRVYPDKISGQAKALPSPVRSHST